MIWDPLFDCPAARPWRFLQRCDDFCRRWRLWKWRDVSRLWAPFCPSYHLQLVATPIHWAAGLPSLFHVSLWLLNIAGWRFVALLLLLLLLLLMELLCMKCGRLIADIGVVWLIDCNYGRWWREWGADIYLEFCGLSAWYLLVSNVEFNSSLFGLVLVVLCCLFVFIYLFSSFFFLGGGGVLTVITLLLFSYLVRSGGLPISDAITDDIDGPLRWIGWLNQYVIFLPPCYPSPSFPPIHSLSLARYPPPPYTHPSPPQPPSQPSIGR